MHPTRPCQRTRLAASAMVTIDACSCAMIHVNVGATTLRFTPEAFEGLSALILEAVAELAARPPSDHDGGLPLHLGRRVRGEA
ncbi:hypothetical protein [Nannocystis radixulma]|uniref:DUF397 domain-containing protein n=1 Tax=Nannocystis radixulma TaxID=2995305 RepID=A0ABT5BBX7_9BACT|nr:hypothetical protein [Nannocystis radixulma]MDC0671039.1 hypothetical protein [Nannocystis radixulma]